MCMFKTVKLVTGIAGEVEVPRKNLNLYVAENPGTKSEMIGKYKIYIWDGEAWFEKCRLREQAHWRKKWARWEKRAGKEK
jgi:hypothetical protein